MVARWGFGCEPASAASVAGLRKLLDELSEDYDRIYLDTPPALNFYAVSALIAADRVLIPFDCDSFSRQALYGLIAEIDELKEDHNEGLEVEGIVVNQFQARASLPQQIAEAIVQPACPRFRGHDRLGEAHPLLRVLDVEEIKTVPYAPRSHPFVERLIGTIRREYLDRVLFWNRGDLERKLGCFRDYYNRVRVHASLGGRPTASRWAITPARGAWSLLLDIALSGAISDARGRSVCEFARDRWNKQTFKQRYGASRR